MKIGPNFCVDFVSKYLNVKLETCHELAGEYLHTSTLSSVSLCIWPESPVAKKGIWVWIFYYFQSALFYCTFLGNSLKLSKWIEIKDEKIMQVKINNNFWKLQFFPFWILKKTSLTFK